MNSKEDMLQKIAEAINSLHNAEEEIEAFEWNCAWIFLYNAMADLTKAQAQLQELA